MRRAQSAFNAVMTKFASFSYALLILKIYWVYTLPQADGRSKLRPSLLATAV